MAEETDLPDDEAGSEEEAPATQTSSPGIEKLPSDAWLRIHRINAAFGNWLLTGHPYEGLFINPLEQRLVDAVAALANGSEPVAHRVRRLPGVIPQLLQSLRSDDFSGAELARKISHDPTLVAAVVRLANSSYYHLREPIASIQHAILVIGQDGLRQLITSVAFQPIIDLRSGYFTRMIAPRLWMQSERCALACRLLATEAEQDQFSAFLAGLILNVGLTVSLRLVDNLAQGDQDIGSEAFCQAIASHARRLSVRIGQEWKFPEEVIVAIREQGDGGGMSPLGRILACGDRLSKMLLLSQDNLLEPQDAAYFGALPPGEAACLEELRQLQLSLPGLQALSSSAR